MRRPAGLKINKKRKFVAVHYKCFEKSAAATLNNSCLIKIFFDYFEREFSFKLTRKVVCRSACHCSKFFFYLYIIHLPDLTCKKMLKALEVK